VDIDQFKPLSLKKQRMVLSVGSLTPLKGFDFLIQALAEIPSDERPRLVIASNFQNQPEKMYLSGLARDKGVNIEMMARIDDNKLVELYNQALLTLYAPVREPFGLVPLESMACGTPVIGVREGGIQETILHEHTGLLVERDRQKFASAIQILIADSTNLNTMCVNSRKYVLDRWTWGRAVESLENDLLAARDLKFI
jgi:glycosyltransferase involved in cell wall biosynthesis